MTASNRVVIFDTTLRDGEQSPGASMDLDGKLAMANALAELGVDILEAGFPIASVGDFEAVRAIAQHIQGPTIAGLARCNRMDIDRAWEALKDAPKARLHVFLATSAIHREHKLAMAKEEIVRRCVESVTMARELCDDVEFSPEDAARTEPDFLAEVVEKAIEAGASTVNIPDTVGYAMPGEFGELITYLKQHVSNIDDAIISVHCHNDLGLAVANSFAALGAGARQIECTINGIGERAGNASLEEARHGASAPVRTSTRLETGIDTKRIYPTSRLLCQVTGLTVQRNKAIVGQNAFAHEAGIHQHGVIQHRLDLRDHETRGHRPRRELARSRQAQRPSRASETSRGARLRRHSMMRRWSACSPSSKRSRTPRRKSSMRTSTTLMNGTTARDGRHLGARRFALELGHGGRLDGDGLVCKERSGRIVKEAACGDGPGRSYFPRHGTCECD